MPEQRLLADELNQQVRQAVEALPPAQRAVVSLRDIDGPLPVLGEGPPCC